MAGGEVAFLAHELGAALPRASDAREFSSGFYLGAAAVIKATALAGDPEALIGILNSVAVELEAWCAVERANIAARITEIFEGEE